MKEMTQIMKMLNEDEQVHVNGINVYLEWKNGSDLDIQVMCGCGKWHGYGCR